MAGGYKIRIADGSEIGPMDLASVRQWLSQGLIDRNSPVLPPGGRWTTVGQVNELAKLAGGARASSELKEAARAAAASPTTTTSRTRVDARRYSSSYSDWSERWRTLLAGIFFFAGAAATGFLAWKPQHALLEFDGAPWLELALVQLAFGLALIPGWELGRKIVRVGALLAALAIFPLTGILFAQGVRGTPLLAVLGAWLIFSGLFAFLGESVAWLRAGACLIPILAGGYATARYGWVQETEERRQVREWASTDSRFADETRGVALQVPPGWVVLKKGNPLVPAPSESSVTLAQPRAGAFAYFFSESSPRGVASLDDYLGRVFANRRTVIPSLREVGRSDVTVGTLQGRKAAATWESAGSFRDTTVVWRDGWVYFTLVTWLPEAAPTRFVEAQDALLAGFRMVGAMAGRLEQAVQTVTLEVPQLTAPAAEILMGQSAAQVLEPDQAFRRSLEAMTRALPAWSPAETQEMSQLIAATYASLPAKERGRLAAYIDKVRAGESTSPQDDREMAGVMKGAILRLSPPRRERLQALYEKAVRSTLGS